MSRSADDMVRLVARLRRERDGAAEARSDGFEIALTGDSGPDLAPEVVAPYAAAGVTWWLESMHVGRADVPGLQRLIERGPPTLG
jgi:hypothetical protein